MKNTFIRRIVFLSLYVPLFLNASVKEMTLEEKIGQLLIVQFRGDTLNKEARSLIHDLHVSGFIYYKWANALQCPEKIKLLSSSLQDLANPSFPLFIAVDQEGGVVNRLDKCCTHFPGNRALSIANDLTLAKHSAYFVAKELKALGINMNLSPVVDVNTNPKNPIIGIRSFGNNPKKVSAFAKAMLEGYHMAGMITTLKHFPGHGAVSVDSHQDLPTSTKNKQELKSCELIPFFDLAKDTDMIMTAHISFPLLDPDYLATFSKPILNILRKDLHYDKVIISDSIGMKGCLRHCKSIEDGAIKAINAGCDLLILGGEDVSYEDTVRVHQTLVHAVREQIISVDRINEAVHRVLLLKKKYDLCSDQVFSIDWLTHRKLAQEIAQKGLIIKKNKEILPLEKNFQLTVYTPDNFFKEIKEIYKDQTIFPYAEDLSKNGFQFLLKEGKASDLLLIFLCDTYKNKTEAMFVKSILNLNKPTILIALKNPIDADEFLNADYIIYTHSPSITSIQETYDIINSLIKVIFN